MFADGMKKRLDGGVHEDARPFMSVLLCLEAFIPDLRVFPSSPDRCGRLGNIVVLR